jgi:hypothetical protein
MEEPYRAGQGAANGFRGRSGIPEDLDEERQRPSGEGEDGQKPVCSEAILAHEIAETWLYAKRGSHGKERLW